MSPTRRRLQILLVVSLAGGLSACGTARRQPAYHPGPAGGPARAATYPSQPGGAAAPASPPGRRAAPDPSWPAGDPAPTDLGLRGYRGAEREGTANVSGGRGSIVSINLSTTDSFAQVAAFYQAAYPSATKTETIANGANVLKLQVSGPPDLRTVTVMKRANAPTVAITLLRHRTG